jgi:WD40 repeat protein
MKLIAHLIIVALIFLFTLAAQTRADERIATALPGFVPITTENVSGMEMGFAFEGECRQFSPDSKLLATTHGIYDIASGRRLVTIVEHPYHQPFISPDGTLVAVGSDGVYDIATGQRRFEINNYATFSPDSTMVGIWTDGIYDTATGQQRLKITGYPVFSPDSALVEVSGDGVYDLASGQRQLALSGYGNAAFNHDGTLMAVGGNGLYEVEGWRERFAISGASPEFSPDGKLLSVGQDGMYNVATGQRLYSFTEIGYNSTFSPDGKLVVIGADGVYDVATGRRFLDIIAEARFNPDGRLLAVAADGVYDTNTLMPQFKLKGDAYFSPDTTLLTVNRYFACEVYGVVGSPWPYRTGYVYTPLDQVVNLYNQPGGSAIGEVRGSFVVHARTSGTPPHGLWYRVEEGWVWDGVVEVEAMPDGVPIEDP